MSKVLVVKAHPFSEEYSRTMKVTNAFFEILPGASSRR